MINLFIKKHKSKRVHLQFCKRLLVVKKTTQNNLIYGELGRTDYQTKRYFIIIKYWLKIVNSAERKYFTYIYNIMLADIEENDRKLGTLS